MNRIKILREDLKLSQADFAKKVGLTQQSISLYEKGDREPSLDVLKKLADFFDVSTDYLLGKTNIKNQKVLELDDIDIAFASGVKGLNDENKETLRNIMEGLLAKQELEKNSNNKKE